MLAACLRGVRSECPEKCPELGNSDLTEVQGAAANHQQAQQLACKGATSNPHVAGSNPAGALALIPANQELGRSASVAHGASTGCCVHLMST